jgi:hypothetical protein
MVAICGWLGAMSETRFHVENNRPPGCAMESRSTSKYVFMGPEGIPASRGLRGELEPNTAPRKEFKLRQVSIAFPSVAKDLVAAGDALRDS